MAVSHSGQAAGAKARSTATLKGWRGRSGWNLLLFVVCDVFLLNAVLLFFPRHVDLTLSGGIRPSSFYPTVLILSGFQMEDSLGPMLPALHMLEKDRSARVYEAVFFEQHIKFQYPQSSLLPYYFLERAGVSDRG
jgi:hypothetical protein